MEVKYVTKDTVNTQTTSNTDIILDVTIGNGQIGGSIVRDDATNELITKGITNLRIGNPAELKGRTLKVITNVSDVNQFTNNIVVVHYFHDCNPGHFKYEEYVDNDGDILSLTTKYFFQ